MCVTPFGVPAEVERGRKFCITRVLHICWVTIQKNKREGSLLLSFIMPSCLYCSFKCMFFHFFPFQLDI